ncbi:MAG: gamma-glutamyl-gamma-aminobutyrate hydrolase family protein [Planctomycetes bacterium]|nr:gamma-glutamyl-gamma-aminobutyrate hydrolase family protein [Planctomycetota bacterium]
MQSQPILLVGLWVEDGEPHGSSARFRHLPDLMDSQGFTLATVHASQVDARATAAAPPLGIILSGSRHCLGEDCALDDFAEIAALLAALPSVPVLGICFGHQYLNVLAGGRVERFGVYREDPDFPIQHRGHPLFAGLPDPCKVAEDHGQRVAEPGAGYKVIARSDDGIEAVEHADLPRIGVQFHPEYWPRQRAPHGERVLRNWLGSVVRHRAK